MCWCSFLSPQTPTVSPARHVCVQARARVQAVTPPTVSETGSGDDDDDDLALPLGLGLGLGLGIPLLAGAGAFAYKKGKVGAARSPTHEAEAEQVPNGPELR